MLEDPKSLPSELPLPPSWQHGATGARYVLDDKPRVAVRLAWATGRPLLVIGEPGSGKTQLAAALAAYWKVPLLAQTVSGQSRAEDLLYHFDAVARLADAQVYASLQKQTAEPSATDVALEEKPPLDPLDPQYFLRPGPLWWAWNWSAAQRVVDVQSKRARSFSRSPDAPANWQTTHGSVVLIDEIDKANIELPEGLLDVLDTGGFDVPLLGRRIQPPASDGKVTWRPPLVIITSNGARDLPAPFLRRCIALEMSLGSDIVADLVKRGRAHFGDGHCSNAAMLEAARLIAADREAAAKQERYVPGVAEFLDLIAAVAEVASKETEEAQVKLIQQFAPAVTTEKGKAAYQ